MKAGRLLLMGVLLTGMAGAALSRAAERRGRPPLPPGTEVLRDVPYMPGGHERQRLDLCVPAGKGPFPLVIWVHGGAWRAGSKANCPALKLLPEGYAVASVGYRLSQHAIWPAQIEDCKAAVRWLRAHAEEHRLDPKRFGAWGSSAGGHLVAMLGTAGEVKAFDVGLHRDQSSRVQAVVDFFGPTDFLQMDAHRPADGMVHERADSPESQLIGADIREHPERVAKANPITYVTPDDPPFLIVHGDQDPLVPHHQSELLAAALREAGVPARLYLVKGGRHGRFRDAKVPELVETFFREHLRKPATVEGTGWREEVEVYHRTPQTNLTMHLIFPEAWRATDRRPAVLFFFGGGWRNGSVEQFRPQAEHFARRGLVTARADYRVRSRHGVSPDACVEDARAALRWLRKQAGRLGVDPDRVIVAGGSAGGHLAACTALGDATLPPPAALLLYNPVLDLRPLVGRPHVEGLDRASIEALSPIQFLVTGAKLPPCVLFYGGDDLLRLQGRAFLERADELGLPSPQFWLAPGQRHGFFNRGPWLPATTRLADAFLVEHGFLSGDSGIAENPAAALRPVEVGVEDAR